MVWVAVKIIYNRMKMKTKKCSGSNLNFQLCQQADMQTSERGEQNKKKTNKTNKKLKCDRKKKVDCEEKLERLVTLS